MSSYSEMLMYAQKGVIQHTVVALFFCPFVESKQYIIDLFWGQFNVVLYATNKSLFYLIIVGLCS